MGKLVKVYIVGAGPGDPGLITARGLRILRQADVVIYDYLVDSRILEEAKEGAELISCDTIGKRRYSDGFLKDNDRINQLIIKKVKEGKKVIRLKNGDPSIFARTSEELGALVKEGIRFEIVPGVTAASAASALCGIPLTDRTFASSVVFVTGHEDPAKMKSSIDWKGLAGSGTIVLYMAVENLSKIVNKLRDIGKRPDTPIAVIQDAGLLTQKVLIGTLRDIVGKARKSRLRPPAIIIIGNVVNLEKRFNWLRRTRRILFTGLSNERFFTDEKYLHLPLIRIMPMGSYREFDRYLKDIRRFDWIVFSSRYGVEYFFKRLKTLGRDLRALSGIKIAAVGNSTKSRLSDFGIIADLVPTIESSQGLLKEFGKIDLRRKRVFLPRSNISDKDLSDGLERLGADVVRSFAYRNVIAEGLPDLDLNSFDEIVFTSPSGVRSFVKRYKNLPRSVKRSYIGDVTRREAIKCGLSG